MKNVNPNITSVCTINGTEIKRISIGCPSIFSPWKEKIIINVIVNWERNRTRQVDADRTGVHQRDLTMA